MNSFNKANRNRSKLSNYLFRSRRRNKPKSILRQLVEAILLLTLGIYIVIILNSFPELVLWDSIAKETWITLVSSLKNLTGVLINIGIAFIIILLLFASLISILSGSWRLLRVLSKVTGNKNNNNKRITYGTKNKLSRSNPYSNKS